MKFLQRTIFISIVLLLALSIKLLSQQIFKLDNDELSKPIKYKCLFESEMGIIWLGTNAGLAYFNGLEFKLTHNIKLLDGEMITALGEEQNGKLYIGTNLGRIFFKNNHKIVEWELEEGFPVSAITGIEYQGEKMWFSTYGEGVYVHDKVHLYNINMDDGLLSNDIYEMEKGTDGIWLATDAGINIVGFDGGKKKISSIRKKDGLLDEIVLHIRELDSLTMEIGYFESGISNIHSDYYRLNHFPNQNYDDRLTDAEGNKWSIGEDNGIEMGQSILEFYPFEYGPVQAVLVFGEKLMLGTPAGLFEYDIVTYESRMLLDENINFISLEQDGQGNIWAGSFGNGLYCYNSAMEQILHITDDDGIAENSILDIHIIGNKVLLGTLGGISELLVDGLINKSNIKITNIGFNQGLGTNYVYAISQNENGHYFVGMDGQGLSFIVNKKEQKVMRVNSNDLTLPITVFNIASNGVGPTLFGSSEHGLLEMGEEGLIPSKGWGNSFEKEILGIACNKQGQKFVHTEKGIYYIDTSHSIYAIYDYDIVKLNFEPILNANYLTDNSNYWVGGENGLMKINMRKTPKRISPDAQLLDIKLFDQSIDTLVKKRFKYNENYIAFEYIGEWYSAPEKLNFQYQLVGLEKEWISTNERQVVYHHLPSGKYTFKVRASLSGEFDDARSVHYTFQVSPPLWLQPWAIIGGLLVFSLCWYLYLKYRVKRIAEREMLNREKLEAKYQALKSYINPHFLFNSFNTLIGAIEEDPQSAVTYVEKLSDFYRSILHFREKNLIPLKEELEVVENYVSLLRERFGEGLHLNIGKFDSSILIAPLSLQLLVENAVKHNIVSADQPLYITIEDFENVYILIRNNLQTKSQLEPSTKYGLNNLKTRYTLLSDRSVLIKEENSEFKIFVPIIKKKIDEDISH